MIMRHVSKIIFFIILLGLTQQGQAVDKNLIQYVLNKYQHKICNRDCLFYPAKNPKRLLISFNGVAKNKYMMWSWFWKEDENWDDTAYLFLKDDDTCWYLGNNQQSFVQDYSTIINHFIAQCKISNENVFTIGGSMGGYAAIFYATTLGLKGAIAINPQVDRKSWKLKVRGFDDIGRQWRDLQQVVGSSQKIPFISLIYSYHIRDKSAGNILLETLKEKGALTLLRRHNSREHTGDAGITKEFVEGEIRYFESLNNYNPTKSTLGVRN